MKNTAVARPNNGASFFQVLVLFAVSLKAFQLAASHQWKILMLLCAIGALCTGINLAIRILKWAFR